MTTYTATATRSGTWWAIEVTSGLPHDMLGVTQARRLSELERVTKDVIVDLTEIDRASIEVDIQVDVPSELARLIELYNQADDLEAAARTQAATDRSAAAAGLLKEHLTMREAAQLLGISHQRIKQLADRAA